jgi:hypothetical protein
MRALGVLIVDEKPLTPLTLRRELEDGKGASAL